MPTFGLFPDFKNFVSFRESKKLILQICSAYFVARAIFILFSAKEDGF